MSCTRMRNHIPHRFESLNHYIYPSVYYVSKILRGAEIRYPKLDKLAMIVVHTSKKLRQYFQAHSIIIRTNFPLRKILQRPETLGRLVQWSVQLGEFDISYESRQQIKAQALADFV